MPDKNSTQTVQVLTPDYVIEGPVRLPNIKDSHRDYQALLGGGPAQYYAHTPLQLTLAPAHVRPISGGQEAFDVPEWSLTHRALVVLIPKGKDATDFFLQATGERSRIFGARGRELTFRAVVYANPYVINCSLREGSPFAEDSFVPATDVQIDCPTLETLKAPWVLINVELAQGYHPIAVREVPQATTASGT